jgi:hypothetical protein
VDAQFSTGARPVPLRGGWFLYVGVPGGAVPTALVARDAMRAVIGRVDVAPFLSERP